jgi:putative SOS response-associated peptidase YedK
MCGRYYRRSDKQRIADHFRVRSNLSDFVLPDADYNVAPTTMQPVIREARDTGDRELVLMRWGLIPYFTKALSDVRGITTINARAETVATSPTYRTPFQRRRCIIPATGFYEWQKISPSQKQPYRFDLSSGEPLAFAGLWDAWKEPKKSAQQVDTWLQSFTIITTDPNELMAPIHSRMPVILRPSDYDRWLSRAESDPAHLPLDLLRPYPADEMEAHQVHPGVGNVQFPLHDRLWHRERMPPLRVDMVVN